ncbi:hypothetical protein MTR_0655s0010 [Medicago truncatula]|uniref:Uncharacterized protein n=1 Tax=Medicago truncatula TaxID=3880 RepID=A0A072TEM2_MEDTR|nr:hypothetical protein MTR_0655s0010 [Medicago truncatula]
MALIYISNSPPQVGRCSQHFQLGMNNTIVYQTKENTRRDAGNTSAKRIATTFNHHPVEANNHKTIKDTTLNHQANHLAEAQQRESKHIQKQQ